MPPFIGYDMNKNCTICCIELNLDNQVCYGYRNGKARIRSICKKCRSKESIQRAKKNIQKRRDYANAYARKTGRVKSYPCLRCGKLLERRFAISFCSDMCRFMNYVLKTDYCWLWSGGRNRSGYGKFSMNSKVIAASRASYILFNGPIAAGKYVCHTCDNPPCVNPGHLWEGTASENQLDSVKKGRHVGKYKKVSS